MNTQVDFDPLLKIRHLRLLEALHAAGIQATADPEGQWMVTMPSARYYGWLSFAELEPPMGEWVVAVLRDSLVGLRVVKRVPAERGFDMTNDRCEMSCMSDYLFWMPKP